MTPEIGAIAAAPPPFRRMLALNSDIEFTTWPAQIDLLRLFAERGLETAFSYWMFCDPTITWRFFDNDGGWSREAPAALRLARSGLLDTLHSFGGAAHIGGVDFARPDILRGFERLEAEGVRTPIYSNHGTDRDVQNIGGPWSPPRVEPIDYRNYWAGDLPDHPVYHLDRTLVHGARFFWLDVDRARSDYWFSAAIDEARDGAPPLFVTQISRDGSPLVRFRRTDFGETPWPDFFAAQINKALDAPQAGFCVVYNHFGFSKPGDAAPRANAAPYFDPSAFEALDRLAAAQAAGDILVTTTERLLRFGFIQAAQPWMIVEHGEALTIAFNDQVDAGATTHALTWADFDGWALRLAAPRPVELTLGTERRPADIWQVDGAVYAGLRWRSLPVMDLLDDALRSA